MEIDLDRPIIGLGGKAGSGKDTAAGYLEQLGYKPFAFADALKFGAAYMFGFTGEQVYGSLKEEIDSRFGLAPRFVLQRLGTVCREMWPEIFIAGVRRALYRHDGPAVITDVRLLNEGTALRQLGALMIRIERDGAQAVNGIAGHTSETELDGWLGWDEVIQNNGSIFELKKNIGYLLQTYQLPPFDRG